MTPGGVVGLVLGLTAVVLLIRAWIEPTLLEVTHVQIALDSPAKDSIRILLLADLHTECLRVPAGKILAACADTGPDIILFAGDLSGRPADLPAALDLLRQIRSLPGLAGCPCLATRGNHDDSPDLAAQLQDCGVQLLVNAVAPLVIRNKNWLVMGLDDLKTGHPDITGTLAEAERLGVPAARRLVLAHNPDTLLELPPEQAALFLSGHLHGGQIWMPFQLEFYLLRGEKLPRNGHIRGFFNWHGLPAYISRGLGCVLLPLRLFSKPEITIIDLQSQAVETDRTE